jgi:hypothetical protein
MAGCEESQGQELLLSDDGQRFFEFRKVLERHWAGVFFSFSSSLLLAFIIADQDHAERDRNRKKWTTDWRNCCFGTVFLLLRGSNIIKF